MMQFSKLVEGARQWAEANPRTAFIYAGAGTAMAAPAVIAGPALAAAGFGASGIAGGSIAAASQAAVGNVAAGSLFATLQSAGMAGYGAAIVNGAIQGGGAAAAIVTAAKSRFRKPTESPEPDSTENDCSKPKETCKSWSDLRSSLEQWWSEIPAEKVKELSDSVTIEAIKVKGWDINY